VAVAVVDVQVNGSNAVNQLRQIDRASRTAEAGIGSLRKTVVGLAGAIGAVGAAKFVFVKTAELETQTRSLQVLTGSVKQAKQIIEELQQLGAVTPFTSTELIDAAKRLQAFGVEGNRVVEVTRRLADASGATGAELQGIVTAYGQVVAKGRLQGEELLQFQERGIGLQQELQKMYKLSGQELQDALSKGRISAEAVEAAIQRLTSTGGKYANGAIAQSDTLAGRLSTLQDGVDQLARRIGQVLTPVLKAVFNQAIAVVDAVNQALAAGRGGAFTRSVFGARQALNVGATSQAVDNIAKGIGQVSSQKNKAGIEQNLQALQKYQRLLQSIGPDDPNAGRAVELQGLILQKIDQNIAAQKELNKQTKSQGDLFKVPELAAPTAGKGKGKGKSSADQLAQLSRQVDDYLFAAKNRLAVEKEQDALNRVRTEADVQRLEINRKYAELTKGVTDATVLNNAAAAKSIELQLVDIQLGKELGGVLDAQAAKLKEQAQLAGDAAIKLQEFAAVKNPIDQLGASIGVTKSEFSSLVSEVARGTATIGDAFQRLANSIIDNLIQIAAQQAVTGLIGLVSSAFNPFASVSKGLSGSGALGGSVSGLGIGGSAAGASYAGATGLTGIGGSVAGSSFGGFQGAFANGGSVMSGKPALVGERGPELFVPGRSGSIVPNNALGGSNIVVNVDATGTQVQGDQPNANKLGEALGAAVRAELLRQKRPGGLLA
jgi:tape measure domain-containing protein